MFSPFERAVAFRYLRARKGERFVSVIAIFSLVGIALGVATLIIVMSVMNGFRQELLGRILGLNGHLGVFSQDNSGLRDFDDIAARIRQLPGIVSATPIVEVQVLFTSENGGATGGLARGIRPEDLRARPLIAGNIRAGDLSRFTGDDTIVIGTRLARRLGQVSEMTLARNQMPGDGASIDRMPQDRVLSMPALGEPRQDCGGWGRGQG